MFVFKNKEELKKFLEENLVDMTTTREMLNCSRQNIHDLMKRNKLESIKIGKGNLFFKKDIEKRIFEGDLKNEEI